MVRCNPTHCYLDFAPDGTACGEGLICAKGACSGELAGTRCNSSVPASHSAQCCRTAAGCPPQSLCLLMVQ
jgi:hypothetical protein